jgi:hypothetical protein
MNFIFLTFEKNIYIDKIEERSLMNNVIFKCNDLLN